MGEDEDCVLILCNVPDEDTAVRIARDLVSSGNAACANVLGRCRSIYCWEGKVEDEAEVPVLIKATAGRFEQVRRRIVELHPYDVPEVVALPISRGHGPYLEFVRESCAA